MRPTCVRTCVAFGSGALAPLAGTVETTPEMWEISPYSRNLMEELVARARGEGGLRPDITALDILWLIEQLGSRCGTRQSAEDDNIRQWLVAVALAGLRARGDDPLPGTSPSAQAYEGRWRYAGPGSQPVPS